ncbi:DUF3824 domain-containing protein [Microbacterium sp. LMI1-1-1.1]|uniref:DUF3824 domain-containing protein n=1 Tax=Microbacterium sp. LMI1-1-1.1 TaxID=3135223 RepID=UPI0034671508
MTILPAMYGDSSDAASAAILAILNLFAFLFSVIGYVISSFLLMKVFEKAGVQGKWRAWVPVYNTLVLAKLGDVSPWVVLGIVVAGVIPLLNVLAGLAGLVAFVAIAWRVNSKFGKEWPLLLLFLLGPLGIWIWLAILGFGSARFTPGIAPAPWSSSFLADKTVWNGIPVQPSQPVSAAGGVPNAGYGAPQNPGGYPPPPATGSTPPAGGYPPPPAGGATPPPPSPGTTPPPPPQY